MHKGQMTPEHKKKLEVGRLRWQHSTKGKPKKVKATVKQIKTLINMNQGMSKHKAMIKAGYSRTDAMKPKKNFYGQKGVQQMLCDMAEQLVNQELTTQYMAIKMKQWLESETRDGIPDTKNQIEAYKEWKKVVDQANETQQTNGLMRKRSYTIEEFVMGKPKKEKIIDVTPKEEKPGEKNDA